MPSKACHTPFLYKEDEKDFVKEDETLLGSFRLSQHTCFWKFLSEAEYKKEVVVDKAIETRSRHFYLIILSAFVTH